MAQALRALVAFYRTGEQADREAYDVAWVADKDSVVDTVNVSETEFKLDPANPKVAKTGTVEFKATNDGKIDHALEVEGPDGEVKTPTITPGKSAEIKVDLSKPGRYEWYCPIDGHKDQGMKGTIVVAGGGSGGTTTSEDSGGSSGGGYGSSY